MVSNEEINRKFQEKYHKGICPECGTEFPSNIEFCPECEERLEIDRRIDWVKKYDRKNEEREKINKKIDNLMSKNINPAIRQSLKQELKQMVENGESFDDIEDHYQKTVSKTKFVEDRRNEYIREAKLADQVYKAYITDGLSRLEKVNGRFLASLSIKNDIIIEQNNRIIQLLELIANNGDNSNLSVVFCPDCGNENDNIAKFCSECGNQINNF